MDFKRFFVFLMLIVAAFAGLPTIGDLKETVDGVVKTADIAGLPTIGDLNETVDGVVKTADIGGAINEDKAEPRILGQLG